MKQLNDNELGIQCQWMETRRLLINPDGQVLPCCYFANIIYMYDKLGATEKIYEKQNQITDQIGDKAVIQSQTRGEDVLMQYYSEKEKYNIFNNTVEDIINSEWFIKTLPESWDHENKAPRQCQKYCKKINE